MTDYLSEAILELAKKMKPIVNEAKKNNEIKIIKIPYVIDIFKKFEYNKKTGSIGYSATTGQVFQDEIDPFSLNDFHGKRIKILSEFSKVANIIAETRNEPLHQAEYWLSNLTNLIIKKSFENEPESNITLLAISFIRQVEGSDFSWHPIVWLKGLIMVDEELVVTKNLILKQPTRDDIQRRDSFHSFSNDLFLDLPSCILLPVMKANSESEAQKKVARIIIVLQLFRVGSVINVLTKWKSDAIMGLTGGTTKSGGRHHDSFKYPLSKNDAVQLKEFIDRIEGLIPKEVVWPGTSKVDYMVIALQRYHDALLKPEITESRLSFAIMCLEALYLKEDERQELEHRMSQRIAKTLSEFGYQPLEVYNKLKKSYGIRSSFVHGSPISIDEQNEANKLATDIMEYARLSIVVQLQLKEVTEKEKFLSLVDNALLTQDASEKLHKILETNCKVH